MSLRMFFFSSRRRHTRLVSDWSSDVCSSDLDTGAIPCIRQSEPFPICWAVHLPLPVVTAVRQADLHTDADPVARGQCQRQADRKSVVVGKECGSRWTTVDDTIDCWQCDVTAT